MGRRSDSELVEEIISFFIDRKKDRSVSMKDFCAFLNVNSATAKKWLDIISFVKMMCPDFYLEEEHGKNVIIRFHGISFYAQQWNHKSGDS